MARDAARTLLAALALSGLVPGASRAQVYSITDLGEFESGPPAFQGTGSQGSLALGLNNDGAVVGHATDAYGRIRAFRWTQVDGFLDLYPPVEGSLSVASAVNDQGEVVGLSNLTGTLAATLWSSGGEWTLGTLGGARSIALGINELGGVVGASNIDSLSGEAEQEHAFVWSSGPGMTDLGALPGGQESRANDVDESGVVVGFSSSSSGGRHAVWWSASGSINDLGTLGGENSEARAIDGGVIVGVSDTPTEEVHGFLWPGSGSLLDLPPLPGCETSQANDVNLAGMIVGFSSTPPGSPTDGLPHAVRWPGGGPPVDLNDVAQASGWTLIEATGIDENGAIVGYGLTPEGATHAFLLTPATTGVPEPRPEMLLTLLAYPNPSAREVRLAVTASDPVRRARLEVFDIQGRLVARRPLGDLPAGTSRIEWIPEASKGRPASGIYFIRLVHQDGATEPHRVVLVH